MAARTTEKMILLAEDDAETSARCSLMLSELGCKVRTAADYCAAKKLADAQSFDLVLSDIQMSSPTDGVMLAEYIRRRFPATDVILMTDAPSIETAIPALKYGVSDYIIKPFSMEYFGSVVKNCLEKRDLRAELNRERVMEKELRDAYAELEKADKLRSGFLARINHELRTPISVAMMASDLLGWKAETSEQRELWKKMDGSIKQLQAIIEELLLYTKTTDGQITLRRTRMDIASAIKSVMRNYSVLAEERGIKVGFTCDPGLEVMVDAELIKVVFSHLFLNSIHFNKKGGEISIEARRLKEAARIVFRDSGIGISRDALCNVFQSFYQVAEHMTREVGGLGLGLATVKRIVDAHEGFIAVESELGAGSTFIVTLPLK